MKISGGVEMKHWPEIVDLVILLLTQKMYT